jgi:integrase/recombinase XerC
MDLFQQFQNNKTIGLAEGLDEFVAVYMPARNYAERTRKEYQDDIQDLVEFLVEKGIESWTVIGLRDLQHYLAELDRRQLEASSRNRKAFAIKTFFKFLYQSRYLRDDPAQELIPPAFSRKEPRFLRENEYQALRSQIDNNRDLAIVEVFLQTGINLSELANLTLGDLDLPKQITHDPENVGFIKVRRRQAQQDVLPLNWRACEALQTWLAEREEMLSEDIFITDALFVSRVRKPLTPRAIRNMVKKYVEQAGIYDASVRTLRHTMATHYLAKGGDLKSVQEMLGHESAKTTKVYLDLARKVKSNMVQKLAL